MELRDCSKVALWVLAWANDVPNQSSQPIWIKALGGDFLFWGSIHEAYFVFSPGMGGKLFLCISPFHNFEMWVGVLVLILAVRNCSFASPKAVEKISNVIFKPHFLLPWNSLSEKRVAEHRRHWNPSFCSLKIFVINFTRIEKKGFANKLSTFSLKCTPQTKPLQLNEVSE